MLYYHPGNHASSEVLMDDEDRLFKEKQFDKLRLKVEELRTLVKHGASLEEIRDWLEYNLMDDDD